MRTDPATENWFHTLEATVQTRQLLQINWSCGYRMEAKGPDHGYHGKMEQMGEQGTPVQHYHYPVHLLFGCVSHGAANRAPDAHTGEI